MGKYLVVVPMKTREHAFVRGVAHNHSGNRRKFCPLPLNRHAAVHRLATSPGKQTKTPAKKPSRKRELAPEPHAPRPAYEAGASETFDLDDALAFVIRIAKWQIEEIEMQPSNGRETATARARDARTLNDLLRTLERLKALQHTRTGDKRKTKVRDEAERKDALVRRLNQLLEAGGAGAVSGRAQRG